MSIQLPDALAPLFQPKRYKVLYGGRGGAKSWGIARTLLIMGSNTTLRILCAREIMQTIADSVHRLLSDQIGAMGLTSFYRVQDNAIYGANGTEFIFTGLRQQDAHKIKSYEGVDIVWCEEAHTISEKSWSILIPTIRKEGSEIWVSFNPELDTDATYVRFVVSPPANAWVKKLTYRDNPWFPKVLEDERLELLRKNKEQYDYVWEGNPRSVIEGAIYAGEMRQMIEDRRIRPVPYDPALKVHTIWDLGWNDQTSIIFAQRLHSEVRLIDYIEGSQKTLAEYVAEIKERRYIWGKDWLPHDGAHKNLQTGKSAQEILKSLGRAAEIIPKLEVEAGIKAVRMMLPRTYMDEVKCSRLADCMKRYRRKIPTTTNEPTTPVHDTYSHGADAMRGLAVIVDKIKNDDKPDVKHREHRGHY